MPTVCRGMVRLTSLGCPKNFVDTELAAASFLCRGFGLTDNDDEADIQFINTCAFLKAARQETTGFLGELKRWKAARPGRLIIAAGCFAEWVKTRPHARRPRADAWVRPDAVADAGEIAQMLMAGKAVRRQLPDRPAYLYSDTTPRLRLTPPHYAFVKIADGCDNCCSYCLIPLIRGPLRSRAVPSVVREVRALVSSGVREIILIAQDTAAFGREKTGRTRLAELLRRLDTLPGKFYLRLMYVHPAGVDDALLAALKESRRLIRCVEMPVQHISDSVLRAMGRRISGARTREVIQQIRAAGYAVRTTLMTGFPGETAEAFKQLLAFVEEMKFARLGVFAYSREPGTAAAALPRQVPAATARARRNALLKAQSKISLAHNRELAGAVIPVIVDELISKTRARGRTLADAPDIDNTVDLRFSGKAKPAPGDVVSAQIITGAEYELQAVAVNQ